MFRVAGDEKIRIRRDGAGEDVNILCRQFRARGRQFERIMCEFDVFEKFIQRRAFVRRKIPSRLFDGVRRGHKREAGFFNAVAT